MAATATAALAAAVAAATAAATMARDEAVFSTDSLVCQGGPFLCSILHGHGTAVHVPSHLMVHALRLLPLLGGFLMLFVGLQRRE